MRLSFVPLLLALAGLVSGCTPRLPGIQACSFDEECASGEICKQRKCVAALSEQDGGDVLRDAGARVDGGNPSDAGPSPRDAGPSAPDAGDPSDAGVVDGGLACVPDDFANESPDAPYSTVPELTDGRVLSGRICGDTDEYFGFFGFSGDPLQAVATWDVEKDLDLALAPPGGASSGIGLSSHRGMEVTTRTLATTGEHVLRLYPIGTVEPPGIGYELQLRSGLPCRVEESCGPTAQCLMPLWTPSSATGTAPPDAAIFAGGLCAAPYSPCSPENADNLSGEGASTSRETPYTTLPAESYWSCRFDEDWFAFGMGGTGDLVVSFTNRSQTPGSYLVTVFDANGNMIGGAGFDQLAADTLRTVTVPFLAEDTIVFVRVFQLNDDDFGAYSLDAQIIGATCAGATDCEATSTRKFGRTQCRSGACECPDPAICTPPG